MRVRTGRFEGLRLPYARVVLSRAVGFVAAGTRQSFTLSLPDRPADAGI
jgi:hypothetical protein